MTEWRAVVGWEGLYEVSSAGEVRSLPRPGQRGHNKGRVLKPSVNKRGGYLSVNLSRPGHRQRVCIHRLVAEAFIGPRPKGLDTMHGDDDRMNNAVTNLSYGTRKENEATKIAGGRHHWAKRTECQNGHPFTPENTYIRPNTNGARACRQCKHDDWLRRAARIKEARRGPESENTQ